MNPNKEIKIEKLTLNFGAGKDQKRLENGVVLLETITGVKPVKTTTSKRIAAWGIRPGLPIGCMITLRGKKAEKLIEQLLTAVDKRLRPKNFSEKGSIAFGIKEYIDIEGVDYNPDIGALGLQVCVTLYRAGYRIKNRRSNKSKVGKKHIINQDDSISYFKEKFKVEVSE
jgi:large subunit ribosomal protein L5